MNHRLDLHGVAYSDETRLDASRYPGTQTALAPDRCPVCVHIAAHGWSGLHEATHCRGCHAIWGGHSTTHCVSCHRTFSTYGNADRHQTTYRDNAGKLRRRCHDPATVTAGKDRHRFFADPVPNRWGVPIWRRPGRDTP